MKGNKWVWFGVGVLVGAYALKRLPVKLPGM